MISQSVARNMQRRYGRIKRYVSKPYGCTNQDRKTNCGLEFYVFQPCHPTGIKAVCERGKFGNAAYFDISGYAKNELGR